MHRSTPLNHIHSWFSGRDAFVITGVKLVGHPHPVFIQCGEYVLLAFFSKYCIAWLLGVSFISKYYRNRFINIYIHVRYIYNVQGICTCEWIFMCTVMYLFLRHIMCNFFFPFFIGERGWEYECICMYMKFITHFLHPL